MFIKITTNGKISSQSLNKKELSLAKNHFPFHFVLVFVKLSSNILHSVRITYFQQRQHSLMLQMYNSHSGWWLINSVSTLVTANAKQGTLMHSMYPCWKSRFLIPKSRSSQQITQLNKYYAIQVLLSYIYVICLQ